MAIADSTGQQSHPPVPDIYPQLRDTVIIVPAYGEQLGIGLVLKELSESIDSTVLVVNRPNGDSTGSVARDLGAVVVDQNDQGKGNAVRLGLRYVEDEMPDTRYIGIIDADCTYPTSSLEKMRSILEARRSVGMVIARRVTTTNRGISSKVFAWGNRVLATAHKVFNRVSLQDPLSGLRLLRADILEGWLPTARGFEVECELNCFVRNVRNLQIVEVPILYRERVGEKKLGLRHGFEILRCMISLGTNRVVTVQPRHSASDGALDTRSTGPLSSIRKSELSNAFQTRRLDQREVVEGIEQPALNR